MKNVDKVLPNHRLNWSAHILGKRESRRLMGDVVLTLDDLTKDRQFPDGCAPTGWSNELHLPDPRYNNGFKGDAFISEGLTQASLPEASSGQDWNGALPASTLADIDGDNELEAVVNTAHSGLVAYDLPGTQAAVVYWGTGRGNYLRNGFVPSLIISRDYFFIPLVNK